MNNKNIALTYHNLNLNPIFGYSRSNLYFHFQEIINRGDSNSVRLSEENY